MKGMILAAGLGTRLEPLTKIRPKPLFPVLNRPLLGIIIEQLRDLGATGIVINAHHLAGMVERFVKGQRWGLEVEVRVEPAILGTGGGIRNCADFFGEDLCSVVINADIYHTFDLKPALNYHAVKDNLVTLILYDYPRFNQVGIDAEGRIVSVREKKIHKNSSARALLTFTGIHIISSRLLVSMPPDGYFDIMDFYIELARRGESMRGYHVQEGYWRDIGRIQDYKALHQDLLGEQGKPIIHPEARIGGDVRMEGAVCVGKGTHIGAGAFIKNSIIWDEAVIREGGNINECVVGDGTLVIGRHRGEVLIRK